MSIINVTNLEFSNVDVKNLVESAKDASVLGWSKCQVNGTGFVVITQEELDKLLKAFESNNEGTLKAPQN